MCCLITTAAASVITAQSAAHCAPVTNIWRTPMAMKARQFRACLKESGISQRQFARWLGFDIGTVNRWANGRLEVPLYVEVLANILRDHPKIRDEMPS
jgi:DNA-binding transcriptional regulator YiaG